MLGIPYICLPGYLITMVAAVMSKYALGHKHAPCWLDYIITCTQIRDTTVILQPLKKILREFTQLVCFIVNGNSLSNSANVLSMAQMMHACIQKTKPAMLQVIICYMYCPKPLFDPLLVYSQLDPLWKNCDKINTWYSFWICIAKWYWLSIVLALICLVRKLNSSQIAWTKMPMHWASKCAGPCKMH